MSGNDGLTLHGRGGLTMNGWGGLTLCGCEVNGPDSWGPVDAGSGGFTTRAYV